MHISIHDCIVRKQIFEVRKRCSIHPISPISLIPTIQPFLASFTRSLHLHLPRQKRATSDSGDGTARSANVPNGASAAASLRRPFSSVSARQRSPQPLGPVNRRPPAIRRRPQPPLL